MSKSRKNLKRRAGTRKRRSSTKKGGRNNNNNMLRSSVRLQNKITNLQNKGMNNQLKLDRLKQTINERQSGIATRRQLRQENRLQSRVNRQFTLSNVYRAITQGYSKPNETAKQYAYAVYNGTPDEEGYASKVELY